MTFWKSFLEIPSHHIFRLSISLLLVIGFIFGLSILVLPSQVVSPTFPGVPAISAREISRGNILKKQVIFTFDGGEGSQSAEKILSALAKHHVKGTFFLTGKFIERNPDLVRRMVSTGQEVFSHTYDHPHLMELSDREIGEEFKKMEMTLVAVAGVSPKPYFRPPYGDRDFRVIKTAFRNGYQSVYWSVDARDWEESEGMTNETVRERILSNVYPGAIYLMHLGDNITGNILDEVLSSIEKLGYKPVSLTEGL